MSATIILKANRDPWREQIARVIALSIPAILAELSFAIGQIYHDLHTLNPTAGNAFRKMVIRCLGDPSNPMWWIHGVNQDTHLCRSIRIDEDLIRRAMGKEEQHESDNA